MPRHNVLQLMQAAVEKMLAAGNHDDGQILRPRPVEHGRQRHYFVEFAVNDQRAGRDGFGREPVDRWRDQHELARLQFLRDARFPRNQASL